LPSPAQAPGRVQASCRTTAAVAIACASARQGAGFMPDDNRRCHRLRKRPAGRRLHSRTTAAVAIACASARQGAGFIAGG